MATLPPRKNPTPTRISKEHLTPLQILLQLGFPKSRAEKALAATGHRGVQLASDWLLAHVRDSILDSVEPREYVLYACPTGDLAAKLGRFWSESRELGWNGAHNCMPHITLVSFFKAPDDAAEKVASLVEGLLDGKDCPESLETESYVSQNFMGLFVAENQAEWLKSMAQRYAKKLAALGISAEAQTKSLHLTLAYQFPSSSYQALRSMVEKLRPAGTSAHWELRLYSRDPRLRDAHVHKVTHAHVPREHDELELRPGDYIYLRNGVCDASIDGWADGISWLTGISGYLPLNHTSRTAESDSWTLHATLQITARTATGSAVLLHPLDAEIPTTRTSPILSSAESVDTTDGVAMTDDQSMEATTAPGSETTSAAAAATSSRQMLICRHGERVDFTFGAWIPYCFEANGSYVRRDLNMPKDIPARKIEDFQNDSPLTTLGEMQAILVGEALRTSSLKIDVAFASPSLRCVQTLSQILKGMESDIPIRVEPGLIEWLAWYPNGLPTWMSPDQLIGSGFNVDALYEPFVKIDELPTRENAAQYYERSHELIKRMIDRTAGNILIVAHAASLAACTRQLVGGRVPSAAEVTRLVQRVPYLACLTARQHRDGSWQLHPPPFPPVTHTSNARFDWKILL